MAKSLTNPVDRAVQAAGGTQEKLAEMLGVSRPLISIWRTAGQIPTKYLTVIAEKTPVRLADLLSEEQKQFVQKASA